MNKQKFKQALAELDYYNFTILKSTVSFLIVMALFFFYNPTDLLNYQSILIFFSFIVLFVIMKFIGFNEKYYFKRNTSNERKIVFLRNVFTEEDRLKNKPGFSLNKLPIFTILMLICILFKINTLFRYNINIMKTDKGLMIENRSNKSDYVISKKYLDYNDEENALICIDAIDSSMCTKQSSFHMIKDALKYITCFKKESLKNQEAFCQFYIGGETFFIRANSLFSEQVVLLEKQDATNRIPFDPTEEENATRDIIFIFLSLMILFFNLVSLFMDRNATIKKLK